jgi:hypothetical protein
MIFDSGHPDVMRPVRIRRTGAVPGSAGSVQVGSNPSIPGDATCPSPIDDDRFTVRGRSREGQTVAGLPWPLSRPRASTADANTLSSSSLARSLIQGEYLGHIVDKCCLVVLFASLFSTTCSRIVTFRCLVPLLVRVDPVLVHRARLSTGLCPTGDISRRLRGPERHSL